MKSTFSTFLAVFVIGFILWVLLVGNADVSELIAGLIVSLIAAALAMEKANLMTGFRFTAKTPVHLVLYLAAFLEALIRANLDMARRVLSPRIPLNPDVIRVKTSLQSDLGKLVLANSITLTPGTLSVDIIDDEIVVHWIDCPEGIDRETATRKIAFVFEKHLKGFFH